MANTDRARKLLVRTALVTSTTIATLFGAQNFAMLDARDFQPEIPDLNAESNEVVVVTPVATRTPAPVERAAPSIEIRTAAPSITILRQAGDTSSLNTSPVTRANSVIQPPAPVEMAAPEPVIIQGEAPSPIVIQRQVPAAPSSSSGGSRSSSSR